MQLRAAFTQQQYPGSGRNVVAADGLRIIWNVPFCFFSEKGQVLLAGVVLRKPTAHIVSPVKISHAKSVFSSVQNIGRISGSCHRVAAVPLL
jgi:hypothetical protein